MLTHVLTLIPMFLGETAAPTVGAAPAAAAARPPVANLEVGMMRAGSTFAPPNDPLFWFIFWLCTFFFVLLMAMSAYFVFKYRRRPGVPQQRSASHNTPLELTWSVGPLVILFVVFFWGFDLYMNMHVAPVQAEQINVIAKKWQWAWNYDNGAEGGSGGDQFRATVADQNVPVFAIPAGRPVKLVMISQDVMHSSYVPDFRVKIDLYPARYTTMWFQAPKAGEDHYLFCAEYCGDQHSQMAGVIKVLDEAAYQKYKQDNALDVSKMPPIDLGKRLYLTKGCSTCHTPDKDGTGPKWGDVYGHDVEFTDGTHQVADRNYLRESMLEPAKHIVKGFTNQMTSFQGLLSETEINGLIEYIKSLSQIGRDEQAAAKAAAAGGSAEGEKKPEGAPAAPPK